MKASVYYTKRGSDKIQEIADKMNIWVEEMGYVYYINWYAQRDIAAEADAFVKEAISKADNSMKGWSPIKDGTETQYQIHHTDGIEYSYTRHYTK